jgi:type I restriction enzyme S subunit
MGMLNVLIAPIKEQKEIAAFLIVESKKVKAAQSKIEKQIGTLLKYKKSLIHEVITGKKQVYDHQ